MLLFAVSFTVAMLGFGSGLLVGVHRGKTEEPKWEPRPLDQLLEQTRWLPILHVGHRWCDVKGYPVLPFRGERVPIVVLEGLVRLIAENKAADSAFLEHNGVRIGLPYEKRKRLGEILKDRISERAMDDASVGLLGP